MRKVQTSAALSAAAIVAIAAASGAAAQGPEKVHGKVAVFAEAINTTTPPSTQAKTTSVEVSGKLKTRGTCLGARKIEFIYVTPAGSYALAETVTTARN